MGCGGLCAVPQVNLISNEGFGEDATHTHEKGAYSGEMGELEYPLHYPKEVVRNYNFDRYDSGLTPMEDCSCVSEVKKMAARVKLWIEKKRK